MKEKLRQRTVAVAVIYDKNSDSYLLWNNKRWRGYAFPMKHFEPTKDVDPSVVALEAINERGCPLSLPNATASPLDLQHHVEKSTSVGKLTGYEYHVTGINPGQPMSTISGDPDLRWFNYAD